MGAVIKFAGDFTLLVKETPAEVEDAVSRLLDLIPHSCV